MTASIDIAWITAVILISIRLAILMYATPMDGMGRLPTTVRVLFILAASALLVNLLGLSTGIGARSIPSLIKLAVGEVWIGLCLALGLNAVMAAFMIAGKTMDFQSGFAAAGIFNPGTSSQDPLFGTVLSLLAVAAFFAMDFHYLFVRGLVFTLRALPPGVFPEHVMKPELMLMQTGRMFVCGAMLAAPVVFALLLMDVAIGVMARTMPQMNVYFSILPVKIFVALSMLALAMNYLQPAMERLFNSAFEYWHVATLQMQR